MIILFTVIILLLTPGGRTVFDFDTILAHNN